MQKKACPGALELWRRKETITAEDNLELVLSSVKNLPLPYWEKNFFFMGAPSLRLANETSGNFPKGTQNRKKRFPIFCIDASKKAGALVCPVSRKKPFYKGEFRYIKQGCTLLHTNQTLQHNSYLVERITFNIPKDLAFSLYFFGEVPGDCIISGRNS